MPNEILKKIDLHDKIIYLDECAAGVLCGDLFVGGVVMDKSSLEHVKDVQDSKKLSEKKRSELFKGIVNHSIDTEIVRITPKIIDEINIFNARMLGFKMAIENLSKRTGAKYAIIDGNKKPKDLCIETDYLIKADGLILGVSCASVLAKHSHTEYIKKLCLNSEYEKYGLLNHKGYGTKLHLEALKKYGPIKDFHRYSYKPVKNSVIL